MVQEIVKFLKADPAFMNIRPLRYSVVLDLHPDCLPQVVEAKRKLRLRDALLCSYHPNEVSLSPLCIPIYCSNWKSGFIVQFASELNVHIHLDQLH